LTDNALLIKALWVSLQRQRRGPNAAESLAFRSQYLTDTVPLNLRLFKGTAVEFVAGLPDEDFANDKLDTDALGPMELDELRVLLMAYEDEGGRHGMPDPNDLDGVVEWDQEDWDDLPEEW
jgi:hypothetical protein